MYIQKIVRWDLKQGYTMCMYVCWLYVIVVLTVEYDGKEYESEQWEESECCFVPFCTVVYWYRCVSA